MCWEGPGARAYTGNKRLASQLPSSAAFLACQPCQILTTFATFLTFTAVRLACPVVSNCGLSLSAILASVFRAVAGMHTPPSLKKSAYLSLTNKFLSSWATSHASAKQHWYNLTHERPQYDLTNTETSLLTITNEVISSSLQIMPSPHNGRHLHLCAYNCDILHSSDSKQMQVTALRGILTS